MNKPTLDFSSKALKALTAVFVSAVFFTSNVLAATIDPNTGDGYVKLNRKLQCSLKDREEVTYRWWGNAYARVPGQRDTLLFKLEGMNVRQCFTMTDEKRGTGYRMVSREIMLYLDPDTGEILRTWKNPWTNTNNEVIHVANDPVNGRPSFPVDANGNEQRFPASFLNGTYFANFEVPLFYPNPLGGEYQEHIGGTYHSAEIFDFSGNADQLLDANTNIEYGNIAWVRIAKWLPWMKMGDRPGLMYFNAVGKKLQSWNELPDIMKNEIRDNYPVYTNAPPVNDKRKNETSWTYMKKIIDQRRAEKAKTD